MCWRSLHQWSRSFHLSLLSCEVMDWCGKHHALFDCSLLHICLLFPLFRLISFCCSCVCSASEAATGGGCCLSCALLHGRSCSENKDELHAFVKVSWSAEWCGVKHGVIWCDVLRWDDVCCVVWCGEQRSLLSRRRGGHAYKITNSCSDAGSCLAQPQEQQGEV